VLIEAARREVRVTFLVPAGTDHPLVRHAGRRQFGRLLEAGIEIHEYTAALLHAKTMVIDGLWATVGSTNLDHRSFKINDELNVVTYDADVARQLEKVFEDDLKYSRRIDLDSWRRRGLRDRLFELLAIPFESAL
jgi:cardiolipin synthase